MLSFPASGPVHRYSFIFTLFVSFVFTLFVFCFSPHETHSKYLLFTQIHPRIGDLLLLQFLSLRSVFHIVILLLLTFSFICFWLHETQSKYLFFCLESTQNWKETFNCYSFFHFFRSPLFFYCYPFRSVVFAFMKLKANILFCLDSTHDWKPFTATLSFTALCLPHRNFFIANFFVHLFLSS